jgi:hypothetical protein
MLKENVSFLDSDSSFLFILGIMELMGYIWMIESPLSLFCLSNLNSF